MQAREAIREALRDVGSGAGWTTTFALLFATLVGGLALGADLSVMRAITEARAYVAAGSATFVMKADDRIDGRACEALGSHENVVAAGALRETGEPLYAATLPQTPVSSFAVSPGFIDVVFKGEGARRSGVSLSDDAAATLGLRVGDRLTTSRGEAAVASLFRYPDDGRDSLLAFSVLEVVPSADDTFDACWVTIWPQDESAVATIGRSVLPADGGEERPALSQLNQTKGNRSSTDVPFDHSAATPPAAAIGFILGTAQVLRRRLSIASDRHAGVGRFAQVITQIVQTAIWAIVGIMASLAASLAILTLEDEDRLPLLARALLLVVGAALCSVCAAAAATCSIRERALFRYFKGR